MITSGTVVSFTYDKGHPIWEHGGKEHRIVRLAKDYFNTHGHLEGNDLKDKNQFKKFSTNRIRDLAELIEKVEPCSKWAVDKLLLAGNLDEFVHYYFIESANELHLFEFAPPKNPIISTFHDYVVDLTIGDREIVLQIANNGIYINEDYYDDSVVFINALYTLMLGASKATVCKC